MLEPPDLSLRWTKWSVLYPIFDWDLVRLFTQFFIVPSRWRSWRRRKTLAERWEFIFLFLRVKAIVLNACTHLFSCILVMFNSLEVKHHVRNIDIVLLQLLFFFRLLYARSAAGHTNCFVWIAPSFVSLCGQGIVELPSRNQVTVPDRISLSRSIALFKNFLSAKIF